MDTRSQRDGMIRVGEMARRAGVSPGTIKYYDERGMIQPSRGQSDYRIYRQADLELLERILQLLGYGLSRRRTPSIVAMRGQLEARRANDSNDDATAGASVVRSAGSRA